MHSDLRNLCLQPPDSSFCKSVIPITFSCRFIGCFNEFTLSGPQLRELLKWPRPLPLEDERVRLLHEVK